MLDTAILQKSIREKIVHIVIYILTWPIMYFWGKGQGSYGFDWVDIPLNIPLQTVEIPPSSIPVMSRREKGEAHWLFVMPSRMRVKLGGWKECIVLRAERPGFYVGVSAGDFRQISRRKIRGDKVAMLLGPGSVHIFAFDENGNTVTLKRENICTIEKRPRNIPLR